MNFAKSHRAGQTLLEVMLAVAVFSLAAMGLAKTLGALVDGVREWQVEMRLRTKLEGWLAETRAGRLKLGREELEKGPMGELIVREVKLAELERKDQSKLPGIYRVTLDAVWKIGKEERKRRVEVYVYQP
jgi:prepilin-type N-terminal cleavage/methylation domain-containing protein